MRARLAMKKAEEEKTKGDKIIPEESAPEAVKAVETPKTEPIEVQSEVVKAEKKEPVKKTDAQKLKGKRGN